MISTTDRAQILVEALPYIRRYSGKRIVVKYGGAAMVDEDLKQSTMQDIVLMHYVGICPVVVHGGGPEINDLMQRMGMEPRFVNGLRVTDAETVELVEMVLAGKTNKSIVSMIHRHGGRAVGLSGKDGELLIAERVMPGGVDIGFVGEVCEVRTGVLEALAGHGYVPVISSVAGGRDGETFNINADHVAGRLAAELKAEKMILLTDVSGILRDVSDPGSLIPEISASGARELITSGAASKGMIPKIEACLLALDGGVPRAHIIDGRTPHGLLTEIFTDRGVGTMIVADTGS